MTVEEFFDDFLTSEVNLNKICNGECTGSNSNCDICLVTSTYKDLVSSLKEELKILPTEDEENKPSYFLTGSYRRHTMIRPPKDVDLFLVLDSGEYQDEELDQLITPTALIKKLKSTLEKIFEGKDIEIKEQRHSVTVIYSKTFSIDVIPAFETDDQDAYMIPDIEDGDGGAYIVSNPKFHFEYINQISEDTAVDGSKRFKKVVRLIKFVKRQRFSEKPTKIRSFHFELLAAKILRDKEIVSYSNGVNDFFAEASTYFEKPIIVDPANEQNYVDDYLEDMDSSSKSSIKNEIERLHETSSKALEYENVGDSNSAIQEWKSLFNSEDEIGKSTSTQVVLGDTGHAQSVPWPIALEYKVSINAYTYIRAGELKKLGGLNSDGRQLQDSILLKYIAKTNTPEPYKVKWQVVNTGPHAQSKKGLRGNFFDAKLSNYSPSSNQLVNWEHTEYTGKHWIECFVVKDETCVARSGRFYVNIKNREY